MNRSSHLFSRLRPFRPSHLAALPLLLGLLSPACTTYEAVAYVGSSSYTLAKVETEEGSQEVYKLRLSPTGSSAYLDVITNSREEFLDLGMDLGEIDKEKAEKCGVRPYSGLLVHAVRKNSSAERAGIVPDDILLAVNGQDVFYLARYGDLRGEFTKGEEVDLRLLKAGHGGEDVRLLLVPKVKTHRGSTSETIELEEPRAHNERPYAGVSLRAIPSEWSRRIYGDERSVLVISGVGLGSPAYVAGLRAGDTIVSVDGKPAPDLDSMVTLLGEKGSRGETMKFEVTRGDRRHVVLEVELDDYSGTTAAHIPFVFGTRVNASSTTWGVGPLGLITRYSNSYQDSKTRETKEAGSFSMLLGLIKFTWSPNRSGLRLLWVIDLDT